MIRSETPTAVMTAAELRARLDARPRVRLANLPTPLDQAPRLSKTLGGPEVFVKRDDLTGLALGGNKTRKLEFLLGEAVAAGADCVVTGAAAQSNHCRQTAAGCARLGLDCYLVLAASMHNEVQGNLLLDHIFGAQVRLVEGVDQVGVQKVGEAIAEELRQQGRRPFLINLHTGPAVLTAAAGYLAAVLELEEQIAALPRRPSAIVVTSGSGGTHSSISLAVRALGLPYRVIGISIRKPAGVAKQELAEKANRVAAHYEIPLTLEPDDFEVWDGYIGAGYAVPTEAGLAAIRLVARTEGMLLDPVYTGKAMSGLIDLIRQGELTPEDSVVFIHTGGIPALFAYHQELAPA